MTEKARAAVMKEYGKPLEIEEYPLPEPEEGCLLAKIEAAGVCGADLNMWRGTDLRIRCPIILGHEGVGRVHAIGGDKKDLFGQSLAVGDAIVWDRGIVCGKCHFCLNVRERSLCPERRVYGISYSSKDYPHLLGNFAQFIYLFPQTNVVKLAGGIRPEVIVPATCSGATIAHAFDLERPSVGDSVVVQGPGPIGLFAVAFARKSGADKIILVGSHGDEKRLGLAKEFGADYTLTTEETTLDQRVKFVKDITGNVGADFCIECTGSTVAVEEGVKMIRRGGTYVVVGLAAPSSSPVRLDGFREITQKQVLIRGSWASETRHLIQALRVVESGEFPFEKMIKKFSLDQATEALESIARHEVTKAVLIP